MDIFSLDERLLLRPGGAGHGEYYGIAAMGSGPSRKRCTQPLRTGSLPPKGVTVTQEGGKLVSPCTSKLRVRPEHFDHHPSITHRVKETKLNPAPLA